MRITTWLLEEVTVFAAAVLSWAKHAVTESINEMLSMNIAFSLLMDLII